MKAFRVLILTTLILIVVSGCALIPPTGGQISSLEDTNWTLTSYNGTQAVDGVKTTALFKDGQVTGSAGCNSYGGEYNLVGGKNNRIEIMNVISTQMACLSPEGVMIQEDAFLKIMTEAFRFQILNGQLKILTENGGTLIFSAS